MTKIIIKASAAQSDENLIEAIAEGDPIAMRMLYQRHCAFLKRFVLRLTDDVSSVDDIVSEAFLDVWRRAGTFEGRSQVTTWLLAIVRHKAHATLRRGGAVQLDEDVAETIEDPSDDPEITVSKLRRDALVQRCLEQLRPAHRRRPHLLSGEVRQAGVPPDRHTGEHRQDAHVLCPQSDRPAARQGRR